MKVIVHSGRAVFSTIAGIPQIAGTDVILAHRLLKNSVPSHEYLLMTEAAYRDLGRYMDGEFVRGEEICEGLGPVTTYVRIMGDAADQERNRLFALGTDALKSRVRQYLSWANTPALLRAELEQLRRPVKPVGWLRRTGFFVALALTVPLLGLYYSFAIPRRMMLKRQSRAQMRLPPRTGASSSSAL